MPDPVVHHIELCVFDADDALNRLRKFGFILFAKRQTASCKQLVARLGTVFFVITERGLHYKPHSLWKNVGGETLRAEPLTTLCCEDSPAHEVDTVFNLAFSVKMSDVKDISERILSQGGQIIQAPTEMSDEKGTVTYSIVKSNCGNIIHTLINTDQYNGEFLPGFDIIDQCDSSNDLKIYGIDHVTFACYSGNSIQVIDFYEKCFGMNRFQISSNDDGNNGLIISDGVGLRLRAMEYWRCAETGLSYKKKDCNENAFMLVVVESLQGQTNCNVEAYLRHHRNEGIEHVAFKTNKIVDTVSKLKNRGVIFRNPPRAYYDELRNMKKISELGEDLSVLSELGILLDNEDDAADENGSPKKKYLMQIFAKPLFDLKTFFIEIIQRSGARGLGSGNILALVRSIREEERRNMMKSEGKTQEITKENFTSPRQC
ncbi:4-hydroxyphenylpyruvate dioxygenase-like protein [Argiope bruennichi]|uniref:4-hydroxyphenylpyruvate dioxygenase-like n=1 Tax=Argiope bruennichi TaxID=94029 RepID=A0A8T0F998_ARGBR|nr:4-hydroxyphenylpyruvate dioxygenase-like protein [Argiope bruennichi]KAF8786009.1 4-hydroxyphenylpyruvate dioxygenase-like [Argiope bruennichi]